MSLEVQGTVHKIFDEQNINATFKKREFVIETDEKYPQLVKFELVQDAVDKIDPFKVGTVVAVSFNLRGREWNDKYFTNLHAWKIEGVSTAADKQPATQNAQTKAPDTIDDSGDDDLPF